MEHSSIMGGSSCLRRTQCTGSAALEQNIGVKNQSLKDATSDAARGEALHEVIALALTEDIELPNPFKPYVVELERYDKPVELTPEDLQDAHRVYYGLHSLMRRHNIKEFEVELKVVLNTEFFDGQVFGTLDFVGRSKNGYSVVSDIKMGRGISVSPVENMQLGFYTLGLIDQADPFADSPHFVFAIVQPPVREGDETVREWTASRSWLVALKNIVNNALRRIHIQSTSLKSGPWCRFCKAAPTCPERNELVMEFHARLKGQDPNDMSSVELANILSVAEELKTQINRVQAFAAERAQTGMAIPGFKLVESKGHRKFRDEKQTMIALAPLVGEDMFDSRLRSPAQIEKILRSAGHDVQIMEDLVTRPDRPPRLVHDDAPGVAFAANEKVALPFDIASSGLDVKRKA